MAVITFVSNNKEETGKTMSMVAIATHMAIEDNNKILIISTTNEKDRVKTCFFEDMKVKRVKLGMMGDKASVLDTESGIEGLSKIIKSNKLTPEIITNYTKVVFKDRLEIILGDEKKENIEQTNEEQIGEAIKEIQDEYVELISKASMYYDRVFVDLDDNLNLDVRNRIIELSDLIVMNTSQNTTSLEEILENKKTDPLLQSPKTLLLIGRYDKFSKVNIKNVTRMLGEKNKILSVPYNTLFFEASNEMAVPDLFLRFRKITDSDDRNFIFIQEVKRASDNIIYRLQELQARR